MACKEYNRVRRVPNGKTLELYVKVCSDTIEDIIISGDFFAHPEELVDELEKSLKKINVLAVNVILDSYRDKISFAGLDYSDLVDLVNEVLREASEK